MIYKFCCNSNTGGQKKNIPFRRQRMEIDTMVPPSGPADTSASKVDDPYVADLLQVADKKIEELKESCDIMKEEKSGYEEKMKLLQKQVCDS